MKKYFNRLSSAIRSLVAVVALFAFTAAANAADVKVWIEDFTVDSTDEIEVPVYLQTSEAINSIQLQIVKPDWADFVAYTVAEGAESGQAILWNTERYDKNIGKPAIYSNITTDKTTLNLAFVNNAGSSLAISAGESWIVKFKLKANSLENEGANVFDFFSKVIVYTTDNTTKGEVEIGDATTITVTNPDKVEYISTFSVDSEEYIVNPGETGRTVTLSLESNHEVYGLQFDVATPAGLSIDNIQLLDRSITSPSVDTSVLADGTTRVLIYDLQGRQLFSGNSGAIISFDIVADAESFEGGEVTIKNATVVADADADNSAKPAAVTFNTVSGAVAKANADAVVADLQAALDKAAAAGDVCGDATFDEVVAEAQTALDNFSAAIEAAYADYTLTPDYDTVIAGKDDVQAAIDAIAAAAEAAKERYETGLITTIYKWDDATNSATEGEPIRVQAEIGEDGAITLPGFLGSDVTLNLTVNTDGTVSHDQAAGNLKGTFRFGEFGKYSSIYLYAGNWGYDDFEYYVEDGVKTLHLGAYVGSNYDWFDLYIELPEDFEAHNPYADYETKDLTVDLMDANKNPIETVTVSAYVKDNEVVLNGLLGASNIKYTIGEDGKLSSNVNGWVSTSYEYNGKTNTYLYYYGSRYASYDAEANTITDYAYLYESSVGLYYTIYLNAAEEEESGLLTTVWKWDDDAEEATQGESIRVEAEFGEDGAIALPNFLGSDVTFNLIVNADGTVSHDQKGGTLAGSFSLGEFGTYDSVYLFAGEWDYDDFEYYIEDGVKTLHFGAYFEDDWFDLYTALPEDFVAHDPYADYETKDLTVILMDAYKNPIETVTVSAYVKDNEVVLNGLLGASNIKYTIGEDGKLSSNVNGWVSTSYDYNGKTNTYLYYYGSRYASYDATAKTITDYTYLYESGVGLYYTVVLDEEAYRAANNAALAQADYNKIAKLQEALEDAIAEIGENYPNGKDTETETALQTSINNLNDAVAASLEAVAEEGTYASPLTDEALTEVSDAIAAYLEAAKAAQEKYDSGLLTTIYKWDNEVGAGVEGEPIRVEAEFGEDGAIALPNFLGSEVTFNVTVSADGTVSHDQKGGTLAGPFTFGEFGTYDSVYLYAGSWNYDDFSYSVEDGVKTLHFGAWAYVGESSTWFDLYIELPDEFAPYDPYAGYESKEFTVIIADEAGTTETVSAYINGNDLIFPALFGANVTYTIDEEGNITSNLKEDWVSSANYIYNDKTNSWVYWYGTKYLSYDATAKTITDYVWLYTSNVGFNYTIILDEEAYRVANNAALAQADRDAIEALQTKLNETIAEIDENYPDGKDTDTEGTLQNIIDALSEVVELAAQQVAEEGDYETLLTEEDVKSISDAIDAYLAAAKEKQSGIYDIYRDAQNGSQQIYDVTGRALNRVQHGFNIIRKSDGTVTKVYNRGSR